MPFVTESVLGAFVTKIRSLAIHSSIPGGVWAVGLPNPGGPINPPYGIVRWPDTGFDWTFTGLYSENPEYRLTIYSEELGTSESLCRQVIAGMLDVPLSVSGAAYQIYPRTIFAEERMRPYNGAALLYPVTAVFGVNVEQTL